MNVYAIQTPYGPLYVVLDVPVQSDDVRTADVQGDDGSELPVGMYL